VSASDGLRLVLQELLAARGWTQGDLAARVRRSQGSISMLLSGSRRGNVLGPLEEIASVFEIELAELVTRAEFRDPSRRHPSAANRARPDSHSSGRALAARVARLERDVAELEGVITKVRPLLLDAIGVVGADSRRTRRRPGARGKKA